MKFVKFLTGKAKPTGKKIRWGILEGDDVQIIKGTPFGRWQSSGETIKFYDIQLLAPCNPTKIVCIGFNYQNHVKELNLKVPDEPVLFIKPVSSVLGPEGYIVKPSDCKRLDYEAELAVVISRKAKKVPVEKISNYILGYTCFNDVTARDIQKRDGQWTRSKSYDTFAPIGPVVATAINPDYLSIKLILNGVVKQRLDTSNMIFNVEKLVSFISCVMTLYPGDVISTGTPPGVGDMGPGDVVEVAIEEIGTLRNYVTEEE